MKCQDIRKLLLDEINGELDHKQKAELEAHLATCPDCLKLSAEYQETIKLCRAALDRSQAPQSLNAEAIAELLEQAEQAPQVRKNWTKRILAYAAVFTILVVLSGMLLPALNTPREKARRIAAMNLQKYNKESIDERSDNGVPLAATADESPVSGSAMAGAAVSAKAEFAVATAPAAPPAPPVPAAAPVAAKALGQPRAMAAAKPAAVLSESNTPARAKVKMAAGKAAGDVKELEFTDADQLKKAEDKSYKRDNEASLIPMPVSPLALTETASNPFSTFSIDTDNTSFVLTRDLLRQRVKPDGILIKPEEFINFFDYNYPEPAPGDVFSCTTALFKNPFRPDRRELIIGIQARNSGAKPGEQSSFELIVDASGSMVLNNRWTPAVQCIDALRQKLGPNDRLNVTYSHDGDKMPGGQSKIIEQLIAIQHKLEHQKHPARQRIIVLTDGDELPPGPDIESAALTAAEALRSVGAPVTIIGFGQFQNPRFWEKIAEKSGGSLVYVDSAEEVERIFSQEFDRRFQTVADDVKIQVEFNPAAVKAYRLVGYRERLMRAEDFRNDKVRASPVGPGQEVTANYELELSDSIRPESAVAKVILRYRPQHGFGFEEREYTVLAKDMYPELGKVPADIVLAFAAGEFAESLKYANVENIAQPAGIIAILSPAHIKNAQLLELLNLAK